MRVVEFINFFVKSDVEFVKVLFVVVVIKDCIEGIGLFRVELLMGKWVMK